MKKFKKIELSPLTDFEELNLQVIQETHLELGVGETIEPALKFLSKHPRVIIVSPVEGKSYVSTQVKSAMNKNQVFTFPEPNPICIYYQSANEHLEIAYSINKKLRLESPNFDYSARYGEFTEYYKEASQGVMLLVTTIEGFINQQLEDNLELEINGKLHNKAEIERLDIVTKIRQVIPKTSRIDYYQSYKDDYSNILHIVNLRNDVIHLKRSFKSNHTNYQLLFKRLFDLDLLRYSDSIFNFVNTIVPNYLKEKTENN